MKKEVDLMIFDLDGTLVDSRVDIVNSVNFVLERLRLEKQRFGTIVGYIGEGIDQLLLKVLGDDNSHRFKEAYDFFMEHHKDHFMDNTVLYPHVREIITYFRNKHMAIISNRNVHSSRRMLEAFKLLNYFEMVLGGDDVYCRKPSACPVYSVIDKLGISRDRSIVVGDMDIDVKAGREAGILTCAVTYGIGKRKDIIKSRPDFIIDDLTELKNIIS